MSDRAKKVAARTVEPCAEGFRLWTYHPQWGGYVGHAAVEFSDVSGDAEGGAGCFELYVYHDGEFPRDEVCFHRHCCSALQFIEFGLDVYEAQVEHQRMNRARDAEELANLWDRLCRLLAGATPTPESPPEPSTDTSSHP